MTAPDDLSTADRNRILEDCTDRLFYDDDSHYYFVLEQRNDGTYQRRFPYSDRNTKTIDKTHFLTRLDHPTVEGHSLYYLVSDRATNEPVDTLLEFAEQAMHELLKEHRKTGPLPEHISMEDIETLVDLHAALQRVQHPQAED